MSDAERRRREASARARARQAAVAIATPSRPVREWTCDGCGRTGPWEDGWRWFGRYKISGHGASAGETEVIEAVACPACPDLPDFPPEQPCRGRRKATR
jgi:hypothetical protein